MTTSDLTIRARKLVRDPAANAEAREMAHAYLRMLGDLNAVTRRAGSIERLRIFTTLATRRAQETHVHDYQPSKLWGNLEVCDGCGNKRTIKAAS